MPRKPRFYLSGVPAHVMQRGHNREPVFFEDVDYREYLKILKKVSDHYQCQIHAYVLMTNHLHLLVTPSKKNSISLMFQSIGRLYVTYINKTYKRSGTLWEGRHKGNIIETESYFMACMKYIELNPVRSKMVNDPNDYYWSSYAANAYDRPNIIITKHQLYLSLASENIERLESYRSLFDDKIEDMNLKNIRMSVQSGTPLGSEKFIKKIETLFSHSVGYRKRGRPSLKKE